MGIIVEFFAAPDDVPAALVLQTGPRRAFESLSFGNFDPEEAVVEWECLLVDGSFEELVEAGEPRVVAGQGDDGCVAFALSSRLAAALAEKDVAALVVARGDGSELFQAVERPLDGVALPVAVLVEPGRPSAA
ncbi:hypothetical protein [Streptomyces sp. Ncost-T10-10d]|uniref:hypothetical protein n=1 Tax=Streptomyces sp. Ncost-T10-10d TaxID=1839774 RepID=UPI0035224EEA